VRLTSLWTRVLDAGPRLSGQGMGGTRRSYSTPAIGPSALSMPGRC